MISPYEIQFMRTREMYHRHEKVRLVREGLKFQRQHTSLKKLGDLLRKTLASLTSAATGSTAKPDENQSTLRLAAS